MRGINNTEHRLFLAWVKDSMDEKNQTAMHLQLEAEMLQCTYVMYQEQMASIRNLIEQYEQAQKRLRSAVKNHKSTLRRRPERSRIKVS